MPEAVIVDVVRLASGKGKPGGALSETKPVELLAHVLRSLVERNDLDPALVDDVIGGCVGQAGEQALNISRTALLSAGFPESVPATTVDRQCGSSQQAAHFAAQGIIAGAYDVVIAAGVESMSRVPMGFTTAGKSPYGPSIAARYPDGLVNLIDDPAYADVLTELRQALANEMYVTHDSMLQGFEEKVGLRGVAIVIGCMDEADDRHDPEANRHDHTMCALSRR